MAKWPDSSAGKITPMSHYVIEVNIRHVIPAAQPGTGNEGRNGDRNVDDVTRVVTKAKTVLAAIEKAKRLMDVEIEDLELHSTTEDTEL